MRRPLPDDLAGARSKTLDDVIEPGLRILFVGINPGLVSAALGHHFARPGNRFWRAIHAAGLTPTLLTPDRQQELLALGIGLTNIVSRTTAVASELGDDELRAGVQALLAKILRLKPRKVAFLGVSTFRTAFEDRGVTVGLQERRIGD